MDLHVADRVLTRPSLTDAVAEERTQRVQVMTDRDLADFMLIDAPGLLLLDLGMINQTDRRLIEKLASAGWTHLDPLIAVRRLPIVGLRPFEELLDASLNSRTTPRRVGRRPSSVPADTPTPSPDS
jgi:hypothetical protein